MEVAAAPSKKAELIEADNSEEVDDPQVENKENESVNFEESSEQQELIEEIEPEKSKQSETDEIVQEAPEEEEEEETEKEEKTEKLSRLPLGRVKHIMKMDPDVKMASQECVFLISKATELFVDSLAKECYTYTVQNNKKTISKNDVDTAVEAVDCLAFLEGAIDE